MGISRVAILSLFIPLPLILVACDQAPIEKSVQAQAAIIAAKSEDAEKYAKFEFSSASALYDEAMVEMQNEKKYLPFLRKYDRVENELDTVIALAGFAKERAEAEKERIRVRDEKKARKK
jgi:hypothetical protein